MCVCVLVIEEFITLVLLLHLLEAVLGSQHQLDGLKCGCKSKCEVLNRWEFGIINFRIQ